MDTQGSEPRIFRAGGATLSPAARQSAFIVEFWPHGIINSGESVEAFVDHLSSFPQEPFIIDHSRRRLKRVAWQPLKDRIHSDLAPSTLQFVDLALVTPGSPAYLSLADLMSS
jgi:hypothetical protein